MQGLDLALTEISSFWISLVEARGIEPLSENSSELLSTGVVRSIFSPVPGERTNPVQGSVFFRDRYKR
jgi:hypothetical protein